MARVVVGVGASSRSLEALLLADAGARWRRAQLEAVHVYAPTLALEDQPSVALAAAMMWSGMVPRRSGGAIHAVERGRTTLWRQAHDDAVRWLAG